MAGPFFKKEVNTGKRYYFSPNKFNELVGLYGFVSVFQQKILDNMNKKFNIKYSLLIIHFLK